MSYISYMSPLTYHSYISYIFVISHWLLTNTSSYLYDMWDISYI